MSHRLIEPIGKAIAKFAREQNGPLIERWTTWDVLHQYVNERCHVRHQFKSASDLRDFVTQNAGDIFLANNTVVRELPNRAVVVWWQDSERDLSQFDSELLRAFAAGIREGIAS